MNTIASLDLFFRIVVPFVIAVLMHWLIQRFVRAPKNLDSPRTRTYFSVAKSIFTTIIYLIATYYIFIALNINVTPLFASAGVVGIIIGLGVRPFIEDFFTGIFILTQDTISVGDYVEIGGAEGVTEALGLRTVRIKDQNGAIHIFPNREIKKIVNYSRRAARVIVDIPMKSNQPIDDALAALERAIKDLKEDNAIGKFISDGSAVQGIQQISGGFTLIRVLVITRASSRWEAARKYRYLALKELEKVKIILA